MGSEMCIRDSLQLVGAFAVVGVIANLDHFMHLAEHSKRGAEREVYGCRPNMVGIEGRDRDQAVVDRLKNGLTSKHRQVSPLLGKEYGRLRRQGAQTEPSTVLTRSARQRLVSEAGQAVEHREDERLFRGLS